MVKYYSIDVEGNKDRPDQRVPFRVDALGRVTSLCGVNFEYMGPFSKVSRGYEIDLGRDFASLGVRRDILDVCGLKKVTLFTYPNLDCAATILNHNPAIRLRKVSKKQLGEIRESRSLSLVTKLAIGHNVA